MSVSVSPFNHQVATMLSYGGVDLVIGPAFDLGGVHSQSLFNDRSVCIVAADHPDVGDELSQELYESLPHLTVAWWPPLPFPSGSQTSGSDWSATQLAALLDPRPADGSAGNSDADVTTESFMMAPILVSESRLVALVPERLANAFKVLTPIRVLDPPAPVPKLEETMYWSAVADSDPAHEWLRKLIADVATGLE
jgi:DNA-binding transcriptional LysR family regulator